MRVRGDWQDLEQNQNNRALTKSLKGGFFLHPSDEDLSPGTPAGKSQLAASLSGYSYSDFAIAPAPSKGNAEFCPGQRIPFQLTQSGKNHIVFAPLNVFGGCADRAESNGYCRHNFRKKR